MPPPPSPASSTCSDHSTSSILSPGAALSKLFLREFIVYRMEFERPDGPACGIVTKTPHKTLPGVMGWGTRGRWCWGGLGGGDVGGLRNGVSRCLSIELLSKLWLLHFKTQPFSERVIFSLWLLLEVLGPMCVASIFAERKKQPTPVKEIERKDEEEWSLKDVVFVEDSKTLPVGKVIKVRNFFGWSLDKRANLNVNQH